MDVLPWHYFRRPTEPFGVGVRLSCNEVHAIKHITTIENVCPEELVEGVSEATKCDLRTCRLQHFPWEACTQTLL